MSGTLLTRLLAWSIALTLVALPIVGVLNGWFASERWPVRKIELRAEYAHVSAEQIRAVVESHLAKGFFAVQLDEVQDAVSRLPWVERVEARKQWPDTLSLVVYERQPFARWGDSRLVSRSGDLFEVPGADSMQGLPQLSGPDSRLADVIAFHAECLRQFSGSGLTLQAVALSARGSWRLTLSSGALIEIGRVDAMARLHRFIEVWPSLAAANAGPPVYVDLRYENGFAMRWALPEAPTTTPQPGPAPAGQV
ncbi:MAG TPA: cell division protein FtsQ/DivIB [Dokdonella sp.]|uniref:cell division protein FtsQ/DivIB n=1 Tax=Dokdonella sp. TaxID=2291710 RepID=UPI002D7ED6C3|nr:cell division protein FtsQ/DivIB [Dokdonella sp.]HET9031921.1 cell division protein FtsQ/DivIB [Dokdonella sp.]